MAAVRALDNDGLLRRIDALNALYANADRRYREWAALPADARPATWQRHYAAYRAARRAYAELRDTPYRAAGGAEGAERSGGDAGQEGA